jgi:hypothetical protein
MSAERPWTAREDAQLRQLVDRGDAPDSIVAELSVRLGRSPRDVRIRGHKLHNIRLTRLARDRGETPPPVRFVLPEEMFGKRASARGVTALYRYRPLRNETDLDRAVGEALHGRFYFPTRAQLRASDDSDLKLKYVIGDRDKIKNRIMDESQLLGMSPSEAAAIYARFSSGSLMKQRLRWFNTVHAAELDRTFGTICFTTGGNTDAKMWREYASGHEGYCLHLNARMPPLSDALPVEYSNDRREIDIADEGWRSFVDLMLHKRLRYEWEKEYRILYLPGWLEPVQVDKDRYATIHPRCIAGITFGAQIRPEYRTELLMHLQPIAKGIFEGFDTSPVFRSELPELYQAFRDPAGMVTVKPFEFDVVNREQIFG